ncbi:hypothetical protein ACMFMG_005317 [Clarireedia jacksonii]
MFSSYPTPNKPTGETYEEFCKKVDEEPRMVLGDGDARGHWIGREDADVVILYLHGQSAYISSQSGGYTHLCTIEHIQYLHRLVTDINKDLSSSTASPTISVLLLAYSLVPEAPLLA